jgi:hypothetical protein
MHNYADRGTAEEVMEREVKEADRRKRSKGRKE